MLSATFVFDYNYKCNCGSTIWKIWKTNNFHQQYRGFYPIHQSIIQASTLLYVSISTALQGLPMREPKTRLHCLNPKLFLSLLLMLSVPLTLSSLLYYYYYHRRGCWCVSPRHAWQPTRLWSILGSRTSAPLPPTSLMAVWYAVLFFCFDFCCLTQLIMFN